MASTYTVAEYIRDLRAIRATGSATAETSFYPPLDRLLNAAGATLKPPVLFSTQLRDQGAGLPDGGFFPKPRRSPRNTEPPPLQNPERGVVEIKPATYSLDALAREPQTLRYLRHYGLVLITNLREFRLLELRDNGAYPLEKYTLFQTPNDLWHGTIDPKHNQLLPDFFRRVMLQKTQLTEPKQVAWLLASYAREARARAEDHDLPVFRNVKLALEESLGIQFEGEKGEHFFRSTLVQTLFYGIFSAWVLWRHSPQGRVRDARFNWRLSDEFLKVPILRKLFREVSDTAYLNSIQLTEVLELAGDALNRVQPTLFDIFRGEEAVAYFYEPFLEAFDPELRKELGVWYTPREIVHYMVERVDQLLRTELSQPLGLASPAVRILDPCCGTGAYLTSVLDRIHRTLKEQAGDDPAYVASDLRTAAVTRVFGFEIMPAPFVIAHMEIARLLEDAGASIPERPDLPPNQQPRAGVFLTNALTGWVPVRHPQAVMYPELEQEREDSEQIKQHGTILVILGNPPYNGYAGIAKIEEERDLTNAYRAPVAGLPAPQGQGLNDLYIRFFRIAERRIVGDANVSGNPEHSGIVSFISNYSWLSGMSHPSMRHHLKSNFDHIYVDNLHGDRKIGEYAPDGNTSETVFALAGSSPGIQVGTSIATLVKLQTLPSLGEVLYRDFNQARAADRRHALLESVTGTSDPYSPVIPVPELGLPFKPRSFGADYLSWPRLPELFPASFSGIKTARDTFLVDIDRDTLVDRVTEYYDPENSDATISSRYPIIMKDVPRYPAAAIRRELISYRQAEILFAKQHGIDLTFEENSRNLTTSQTEPYYYRPFDLRWLYYEHNTKLLDERREDYWNAHRRVPSMISAQANRRSFDPPAVTRSLASYHVVERASLIIPLSYDADTAPGLVEEVQNLATGLTHERWREVPRDGFFFHALAVMHTGAYISENAGALLGDWPRIPLPASAPLLIQSADLGRRLAEFLDPESDVKLLSEWSFMGALKLPTPYYLAEHLKLTVGWGVRGPGNAVAPRNGKSEERRWNETELDRLSDLEAANSLTLHQSIALLGETCVDVYLNGETFWSAIPVNVWSYTLGGYQVLKKWLSYREFPLLGRPLHEDESRYFAQVVRRIAAILLLGPALDASYQAILPTAVGLPPSDSASPRRR